nr:hypothetical protein [uncultured Desulfuromonas sp.]
MACLSRKWYRVLIVPLLLCSLCCCDTTDRQEIRISVNPWIGFTPVAYAQQKGWLDDCPVRLLWVVGLEENVKLYRQGLSDGFVATQYEYLKLPDPQKMAPYALFDRSCGADVILSNRTIDQLRTSSRITTHLEISSLNLDILHAFMEKHHLDPDHFILHPSDPGQSASLKDPAEPTLIIGYEPYATQIERNGFQRIDSTRSLDQVMVVDALWLSTQLSEQDLKTIRCFKQAIDHAIHDLHDNPHDYYLTVQGYLEGQSFAEFEASLAGIEWINSREKSALAKNALQRQGIVTDTLL